MPRLSSWGSAPHWPGSAEYASVRDRETRPRGHTRVRQPARRPWSATTPGRRIGSSWEAGEAPKSGGWISERGKRIGKILVGSERMQALCHAGERYAPELRTHTGSATASTRSEYPRRTRADGLAFRAGLHSLAWTDKREGVAFRRWSR